MPIVYNKLLKLLQDKGVTSYVIKRDKIIGQATFKKIKTGGDIDTRSIAKLCEYLECQPGDILEYVPDNETEDDNKTKENETEDLKLPWEDNNETKENETPNNKTWGKPRGYRNWGNIITQTTTPTQYKRSGKHETLEELLAYYEERDKGKNEDEPPAPTQNAENETPGTFDDFGDFMQQKYKDLGLDKVFEKHKNSSSDGADDDFDFESFNGADF